MHDEPKSPSVIPKHKKMFALLLSVGGLIVLCTLYWVMQETRTIYWPDGVYIMSVERKENNVYILNFEVDPETVWGCAGVKISKEDPQGIRTLQFIRSDNYREYGLDGTFEISFSTEDKATIIIKGVDQRIPYKEIDLLRLASEPKPEENERIYREVPTYPED